MTCKEKKEEKKKGKITSQNEGNDGNLEAFKANRESLSCSYSHPEMLPGWSLRSLTAWLGGAVTFVWASSKNSIYSLN